MADLHHHFDRAHLINLLIEAGARFPKHKPAAVFCPFHDNTGTPAGSIYKGGNGEWRYKCHNPICGIQGDCYDIEAHMSGQPLGDVLRSYKSQDTLPSRPKPPKPRNTNVIPAPPWEDEESTDSEPPPSPSDDGHRARTYPTLENLCEHGLPHPYAWREEYCNPDTGEILCVHIRLKNQHDKCRPAHHNGKGWALGAPPKPWPIARQDELKQAARVLIVEGEKCVRAASALGFTATTNFGGSSAIEHTDWSPLRGKNCVIWPDNDEPGIKAGRTLIPILQRLGCRVSWIEPKHLRLLPGGDIADFAEQFAQDKRVATEAIRDLIDEAQPCGPIAALRRRLQDRIDGRYKAIPWPWKAFGNLTNALLPGTLTVICGDPGDGKSFFLLQAAAWWHENGYPTTIFELEEDVPYHLERALVQRIENSQWFDSNWCAANDAITKEYLQQHAQFLDTFGLHIHDAPDTLITLDHVGKWVEEQAAAGYRIIAVDPVSAADPAEYPWVADHKFIFRCKRAARAKQCSIILLQHPKKGKKNVSGLDELAGGAAYTRFAQTVVWLQAHRDDVPVTVLKYAGPSDPPIEEEYAINRTLHLNKCRNGKGSGKNIAFHFHGTSVSFEELGLIKPKPRHKTGDNGKGNGHETHPIPAATRKNKNTNQSSMF